MDLKQISYFMWVYEEGSFSKAAQRAQVVQPALSMQIRNIEREFGVRLFDRRSRGVEPTAAGHRLYQRCVPIMREVSLAVQELECAGDTTQISGAIRVGLPGSFNRGLLQPILVSFLERFPNVEISISEAYTGSLLEMVREGRVDFVLGARPGAGGELVQRLVHSDPVVLMSGAPLHGPTLTPCDLGKLQRLKLILPSSSQSFGSVVRSYLEVNETGVEKLIEINGTVGAFELARGSDWGLLTPFMSVVRDVANEGMFVYPVAEPPLSFDLYLVYDRRRPLNPTARRFVEAIEDELRRISEVWQELCDPG